MEELSKILHNLDQGNTNVTDAKKLVLDLFLVSEPLQARRHITEKELMIASKQLKWRGAEIEYLIKKVRVNQTKSNAR